uniref:MARVEL domain-containing protein n=1 Tax=Fusarium oxysporum (strain Fo5176) TaxID=660025 RepID=A0A0D2XS71_FUSOF
MVGTGVAHKAISILLRLGELASAIIVLGILSRFCYLISIAEVHADGRIIYGIVVACLGIIYSILFCPPFKDMFLGFPFDFVITGGHACSARWYYDYWGYYWGRFWRVGPIGTVTINGTGCGAWKTVLAFSFIAWFLHLLSGILGVYVFRTYVKIDETKQEIKHQAEKLTNYNQRAEQDNGTTDNV